MYFARANWYWYWYWYSISRHTRILCLIIAVVVLTYIWDKLSDLLHVRCCSAKDVYWSVQEGLGMDADPGRAGRFVYWDDFVQIARFKKLACLWHIKQKRSCMDIDINKQQQPSLALQHLTCNKSLGLFYIYDNTSSVKIKT